MLAHVTAKVGPRHALVTIPASKRWSWPLPGLVAVERGTRLILVGGSTDTPDDVVHATCTGIQDALDLAAMAASQNPEGTKTSGTSPSSSFRVGARLCPPRTASCS